MPSATVSPRARRLLSLLPLAAPASMLTACYDPIDPRAWDALGLGNSAAALAVAQQMDAASGGSPVLGEAGGHGQAGRWSVAVTGRSAGRESIGAPAAPLKATSDDRPSSAPSRLDGGTNHSVTVTASLGILNGFLVGTTRVFSLDLLGGVSWVGDAPATALGVTNGGLARTIGGRLGIVRETDQLPGIAVSFTSTALPGVSIQAEPLALDDGASEVTLRVNKFSPTVWTRRVTVGKRFGRFGVSAGFGEDRVDESFTSSVVITPTSGLAVTETQDRPFYIARTSRVLGVSWDMGPLLFGAEVGQVRGGLDPAPGSPGTAPSSLPSRTFLTVGARIGAP